MISTALQWPALPQNQSPFLSCQIRCWCYRFLNHNSPQLLRFVSVPLLSLYSGASGAPVRVGRRGWTGTARTPWWSRICAACSPCACASAGAPSWRPTSLASSTSARCCTASSPKPTCATSSAWRLRGWSPPSKKSRSDLVPGYLVMSYSYYFFIIHVVAILFVCLKTHMIESCQFV